MNCNILSFDGGGTRGYGQIHFLEKFPSLYQEADLFAGTSVGSLNASALCIGLEPSVIKQFYLTKAPYIFTIRTASDLLGINASVPSNRPSAIQKAYMIARNEPFYLSADTNSNYGDAYLKREIKNILGDIKINEVKQKILINSFSVTQNKPVLFTNIDIKLPNIIVCNNVALYDAVFASMSAPFYFPAVKLQLNPDTEQPQDTLIDGGIYVNTPHSLSLLVSLLQHNQRCCVCSLGTGISKPTFDEQAEPSIGMILPLLDTAMNSYYDDLFLRSLSNIGSFPFFFYRVNFNLAPAYSDLDISTSDFFSYLEDTINLKTIEDEQEINIFLQRWSDTEGAGLQDE